MQTICSTTTNHNFQIWPMSDAFQHSSLLDKINMVSTLFSNVFMIYLRRLRPFAATFPMLGRKQGRKFSFLRCAREHLCTSCFISNCFSRNCSLRAMTKTASKKIYALDQIRGDNNQVMRKLIRKKVVASVALVAL